MNGYEEKIIEDLLLEFMQELADLTRTPEKCADTDTHSFVREFMKKHKLTDLGE